MANNRSVGRTAVSVAEAQFARVAANGCALHPHVMALAEGTGPHSNRDLADAVHLLCSLHGRHPGMIELAFLNAEDPASRAWLKTASEAFERERLYLVRLTSAVGPLPSTPGASETESSLQAAHHALETLAGSERRGCALGAATALVADWGAIRRLLDSVAARVGLDGPASALPDEASLIAAIDNSSDTPASERALGFGSEQLLLQHRALFDLLEARASARADW